MKFIPYLALIGLTLNTLFVQSSALGLPLTLIIALIIAAQLGKKWHPSNALWEQLVIGGLGLLALTCITYTIAFYTIGLGAKTVMILFLLLTAGLLFYTGHFTPRIHSHKLNEEAVYLHTLYYLSLGTFLYLLVGNASVEAIPSVWHLFDAPTTITLLISGITLLILNVRIRSVWQLANIGIFFTIIASLAVVLYRLGFGYDSFIHQATEELLLANGTITPKPPYYIGHYSLVVLLSYLTQLAPSLIDRFLPALLYGAFIPATAFIGLSRYFTASPARLYTTITALLILPLALIINPTPQATALILMLTVMLLLLAWLQSRGIALWLLGMITVAALCIHPISGLPLIPLLLIALLARRHSTGAYVNAALVTLAAGALYPAAFWAANFLTPNTISLHSFRWQPVNLLAHPFERQYNIFLDGAYILGNSIPYVLVIIAGWVLYRVFATKKHRSLVVFALMSVALLLNVVMLTFFVSFETLAATEIGFFTERIGIMALYCLYPLLAYFIITAPLPSRYYQVAGLTLIGLCAAASIYLAYPRFDDYENSNFVNVTIHDVRAVDFIDSIADQYAVAANQMMAAAALKVIGFDRHLITATGEEQYRYPIPTGGRFHDLYLATLASPQPIEQINEMKRYLQQSTLFVALPSYWSNHALIKERLSVHAQRIYEIDNGAITIFQY